MSIPLPIIDSRTIPKHTVFILVAAGRYDYLERFPVPNIDILIQNGVSYRNAVAGTCIAGTSPGTATLSTGLYVKDHGVPSDYEWYVKETGELIYVYNAKENILYMDAPTLADSFKEQHPQAKIASISTKDRHALLLAGKQADRVAYSYRESVFKRDDLGAYTGAGVSDDYFSWQERVGHTLPKYLSEMKQIRKVDWAGKGFNHVNTDVADTALIDEWIMNSALKILENESPDLLFMSMVAANITGHVYGLESAELEASVENIDIQIGKLIHQLKEMNWFEDTLIVIAGDHGMAERPIGVDVITELKRAGHRGLVENVLNFSAGATAGFYLNRTDTSMIEKTINALLEVKHIKEAWYKKDPRAPWYVQRFAHERAPDIVIIPDHRSVILDEGKREPTVPFYHGPPYPSDLSIWCIFSGAGVNKLGKVGEMLDYSSTNLISDEEILNLTEQASVAPTIKAIWAQ